MNKTAIVIVIYNVAKLVVKQVECIRKFCKDNYDIIIVDNSNNQEVIDAIKYYINDLGCIYMKTNAASGDPSMSHAFACNMAYLKYYPDYSNMLFLDHDCFPIKEFTILGTLEGKIIGGMGQQKTSGKIYLWPGCLMIDNTKLDTELVNFNPNHEYGLDTGGNLYRIVDQYGSGCCKFFDEHYYENIMFNKEHYNYYSVIGGCFMHFINSSNWNPINNHEDNEVRLNSLLSILEGKINQ